MDDLTRDALREEALRLLLLAENRAGEVDRNEVAEHLYDLLSFRPEYTPEAVGRDGDADSAPFFSEAYLYPLLGKEDARTLLAHVRALRRSLGFKSWPYSTTVERFVTGPWIEIEDRTEEELQRGLRLGHLVCVDGEWVVTSKGLRRKARAQQTRSEERRLWGIEITNGPSAGTRIQFGDPMGFSEDLRHVCQRSYSSYRLLLEPLEEGGEPELLG